MTRFVHCPHCGYMNEVDNLSGGISSIDEGKTLLSNTESCRECEERFSIKTKSDANKYNPLFDINAEFFIYNRPVTIPIEHDQDIQFEYDLIVRKGSEIEILFMTKSEFTELKNNRRFRVFKQHCKQSVIEASGSGVLPAGDNVMIMRADGKQNDSIIVQCNMIAFSA